ncbi:hypothetical protein BDP81DRAFT_25039 [Colletotrichum phormii]|uniref:Uncharacterized protein n=1 Tax=Colletotrichum phormii TaxID=359342 RepID=A0AAI9ZT92_9PEZI|nr:uncharacterized protein BDP81DRAFT_25039 [Colletotrichum phormii]KAK1636588.1 hypothetical protein BDP81DRAFT_25039 [Colletotrichum phormii]
MSPHFILGGGRSKKAETLDILQRLKQQHLRCPQEKFRGVEGGWVVAVIGGKHKPPRSWAGAAGPDSGTYLQHQSRPRPRSPFLPLSLSLTVDRCTHLVCVWAPARHL